MIVIVDSTNFNPSQSAILDRMLSHAGMLRSQVSIVSAENWSAISFLNKEAVVLAGEEAARKVLGWNAPPDSWHGSILPLNAKPPLDWNAYLSWCTDVPKYVITYSIENIAKMYEWHPLAARDWEKAGMVERGEVPLHDPRKREWIVEQPSRLWELIAGVYKENVFAFDTEMGAATIFGAANQKQVHVFNWGANWTAKLKVLMESNKMKVAHNLQHDLAMCELNFGIKVKRPYFDTMGGAHLLNTELEKSLSPGISARFTFWPFHKWLFEVDMVHYNGMDNIVCYDGFLEIQKQLVERKLWDVAAHDHDLLEVLYGMQQKGLRVDAGARSDYEHETRRSLVSLDRATQRAMRPIIHTEYSKFQKPHLFRKTRKCPCCGGGKVQRLHCFKCSDGKTQRVGQTQKSWKESFPACRTCSTTGRRTLWKRINPGSTDQVADVLYRGLKIAPRRYKGVETVRADALAKLADRYPLVKQVVEASKVRADLNTVERLTPDQRTGKLHSVFNPWGTVSGRVNSSEGLLRAGSNLMNIPKPARRFIVPDEGFIFLYPDMSQIEARVVAVLSKPYGMELWNAFNTPIDWPGHPKHSIIDSHTMVQQMVSKWVEITRDQAKRLTYAAMYGVSASQLAVELTAEAHRHGGTGFVSEQQAANILQAFFLAFPGVKKWQEAVVEELLRTRTVRSLTGRERHWPGRVWDKRNKTIYREVAKEGWSYMPQEIAAWILAEGLMRLHKHNEEKRFPTIDLLVHVHDAGLMQCRKEELEPASRIATAALTTEKYGMKFLCEMKTGTNWYEASKD